MHKINPETAQFIEKHAHHDIHQLALMARKQEVDINVALQQIGGRQTARKKLPKWAEKDEILYPRQLCMEQCSSESTALYKAEIVKNLIPKNTRKNSTFIDLTGGFGVDFTYLAPHFKNAIYVEQQEELCQIVRWNSLFLGIRHAQFICADSELWLEETGGSAQKETASLIFIDPARRDQQGKRTFAVSDCTPNVLPMTKKMLEIAEFVIIKLSPMLDISATIKALNQSLEEDKEARIVREMHVVATDNECKELLVVLQRNHNSSANIVCKHHDFVSKFSQEEAGTRAQKSAEPHEGQILIEPNPSIMKAQCFGFLEQRYNILPISSNSHLFITDKDSQTAEIEEIGRTFIIDGICTMNKKDLQQHLADITHANIAVRNFPLSAQELRKRLKIADGGNVYIFATTTENKKHVLLICKKICKTHRIS